MKLLLYCTKSKPYLLRLKDEDVDFFSNYKKYFLCSLRYKDKFKNYALNGKIVAECDFEVEEIKPFFCEDVIKFEKESCLPMNKIVEYLRGLNGYAIHIENLHIFDEPRELIDYHIPYGCKNIVCEKKAKDKTLYCSLVRHCEKTQINKAPQNMMKVTYRVNENDYILISIRPEWLCKILNGEKTIEVRKKVLEEMIL